MRPSQRQPDQLRPVSFTRHFTDYAEGSVLACFGNTKVLCTASVEKEIPRFLRDASPAQGWVTAEYGMLPRSTHDRMKREAKNISQGGRTMEIQRLIGRALRAAVDLTKMPGYTITLDCDVIQADGGTRTTAISGAYVALVDALRTMQTQGLIKDDPLKHQIAAVSVGIYAGEPVLDLDYAEDANAHTDMNVVMTEGGAFIEIQGTAESVAFHETELMALLALAKTGIADIFKAQDAALAQVHA